MQIGELPQELRVLIFSYFCLGERAVLCRVCKAWEKEVWLINWSFDVRRDMVTKSVQAFAGMKLRDNFLEAMSRHPAGRKLASLDIVNAFHVYNRGIQALSRCTTLSFLDVSNCYNITDEGFVALQALSHLEELHLRNCRNIKRLDLLTTFSKLQILDLNRTSFGVQHANIFLKLPSLTNIDLSFCTLLRSVPPRHLIADQFIKCTNLLSLSLKNSFTYTEQDTILNLALQHFVEMAWVAASAFPPR
eukprot:TRINITY_DN2411_c0_g1_i4.p1 TRINITY_DN2411_c0_g1~~TRINITY_DN2411_c0_g1_i4.p1  ORF type:complete len:247 (+),score=13.15 TRINITY_DN2411_c0_g1_i4:47-787(+)